MVARLGDIVLYLLLRRHEIQQINHTQKTKKHSKLPPPPLPLLPLMLPWIQKPPFHISLTPKHQIILHNREKPGNKVGRNPAAKKW